jgi:uncharacterized protein
MTAQMRGVELIRELYRAFREKDDYAFRRLCSPEIEWIQNEGFPGGATRRGADEVIEGVFKSFDAEWEGWRFQIDEYFDAGRSVIVLGNYEGIHRDSGKLLRAAAAHVYDVADGRITRFRQYTDTKTIWDAMS